MTDQPNLKNVPPLSPTEELLRYFKYDHLPEPLKSISNKAATLAWTMEVDLPNGPEKTMGIRKLLEAKDCFVRAALPKAPEEPYIGTPGAAYSDRLDHDGEALR